MLVPNPLNVVLAIAIQQKRGAFQRLNRADLHAQSLFQVIACSNCSSRSGCRDIGARGQVSVLVQMVENPLHRRAGDRAVNDVISVFRELVQDQVLRILVQFMTGVIDFLDVAFGAGGPVDIVRVGQPGVEPVKSLLAHPFGQNGNRATSQQVGNGHPTATVVPSRRPDRAVFGGIEHT